MKRKKLLFSMLFVVVQIFAFAQSRTVKGTITDTNTKETLPGVTVLVEGTTVATSTNMNGEFTINVDGAGKKLIISSVGFVTKTVSADQDVINVSMESDAKMLSETVVTAIGISREKKSLGYASQEVKGDAVKGAHEMNVVNTLQGKVAGLNITSGSGGVGASSSITLRGATSLTGNNQPLFVINGIPVDNDFRASRDGSPSYGNPISDLNPDDIESVNILKGPVAAALYGSKALNGAIVVTTKVGRGSKGKTGGFQVAYNFGYSTDKVLRLPEFQNKYGQGYTGDEPDKSPAYMDADESWGAPLDGRSYTDYRGETKSWSPQPNNIKDFFVKGSQIDNAVSIASSDEKGAIRLSFSSFNQKGTVPNTAFNKYTAGVNIVRQLTDRLSLESSVNYTSGQGKNRPGVGYDTYNPLQSLFGWFGRQVNMTELRDRYDEIDPKTGLHYTWNQFHNNPYWTLNNNLNKDKRDRIIATAQLKYKLTDWLSASVRGGSDAYTEERFQIFKKGTVDYSYMQNGGFYDDNAKRSASNVDAMLVANKRFADKFSVTGTLGYNYYRNTLDRNSTEVRGLIVPGLYNVSFATSAPIVSASKTTKENIGVYGLVSLGYKDFLYLDITGRNDWSSALPTDKNSYFYPSVSGSMIFSELMKNQKWLSFGKFRAGVAAVGNDTDPYRLASYKQKNEIGGDPAIIGNPFNGAVYLTQENTLKTPDLIPEIGTSVEIGADVRFLDSRVGLDVTYYNTTTKNLLVPVSIPVSSGYSSMFVNAGVINNQGVEVMLNLVPIKTESGFVWSSSINFAKNKGKIIELANGLDQMILESGRASLYLIKGESYGTLVGTKPLEDGNGNILINPTTGKMIKDPTPQKLGNVTPDFHMGFDNNFTFKNITFGFLFDWQQGGKIFSQTNMWTDYSGLSKRTEDRSEDLVMKGVVAVNKNGVWESTGQENTKGLKPEEYWHDHAFTDFRNAVFDATYIKLRQINLSYSLPTSMLSKTPFSNLSLGVYARNVAILYSKLPYMDPEVNATNNRNGAGFESNSVPSSRSLGVNLKAVF